MDLFVYGTLQSDALRLAVVGGSIRTTAAILPGYTVHTVKDHVVPMIVQASHSAAQGLILHDLSADQYARLDLYEGAFGYTLVDVTVQTQNGDADVRMYVPPTRQLSGHGAWSLDIWQATHETPGVLAATELFARAPMLSHATARRMFPMIEGRAWARHRAAQVASPATLRYAPNVGDAVIVDVSPPQGSFYALQAMKIRHRRFDNTISADLAREVFIGVDASLVLPYDPTTDRVLLVEQMRMGPLVNGDPNPWSLEPIAGMVDPRETPYDAALREAQEEAGLTDLQLQHIASFYPSPGSATDYFHAYIGLCQLSDQSSYSGGLASENEDLRLHTIPYDQAMQLAQTGEITAGPLLMMLYWLAGQRNALRAGSA